MPDPSEGFAGVRFRDRVEAPRAALGFWSVVGAVLIALLAHSLIIGLIVDWQVKRYIADLDAKMSALVSDWPQSIIADVPPVAQRSAPRAQARSAPALPGTIEARRTGADRACINGRIYRRLPNGWDHIGGRCRATSQ
ncbi:hypothetical protein ACW7G2_01980 [Luteimonas sp. A277]